MTDFLATEALVNGILYADAILKGELGRRFAQYLGLTSGDIGSDGGCDGSGEIEGKRIYFQSKLERGILRGGLRRGRRDDRFRYGGRLRRGRVRRFQ